jgi:type IV pilus assembly protein PilQ
MTTLRVNHLARAFVIVGLVLMAAGCASQSAPQSETESPPAMQRTAITDIATSYTDEITEVMISADGPLTFSSLKQPDPLAVLLYFPQTSANQVNVERNDSPLIRGIAAQENPGSHTTRVEIQLAADVAYAAEQTEHGVNLIFSHEDGISPATAYASEESQPTNHSSAFAPADDEPPSSTYASDPVAVNTQASSTISSSSSASANGLAWVNKVDFLNEAEGRSTLVVGTTHAVDYRVNKVAPHKIEIRLLNTRIPSYRQRPLITTRFTSAVDRITPIKDPRRVRNPSSPLNCASRCPMWPNRLATC